MPTPTHAQILDLWPTQKEFLYALKAEGFDVGQPTASMWRTRGIPALYWPAIVKIAHGLLLAGRPVTLEVLAGSQKRLRELREAGA